MSETTLLLNLILFILVILYICITIKEARNNKNNSSIDNSNNSSVVNSNDSINNNDKSDVCAFVCIIVLSLFSIAIMIFGTIYDELDVIPKLEFQINSVEVTSMKVYNVSNDYYSIIAGNTKQQLMADLEFNLTLKNKEQGLMYFSPMEVSLEYDPDDEFLSSTMIEPYLLAEDQRQLQFGMQIKDDDARLQNRIVDSISVQFALKGKGRCVRWHRGAFYNCGINLLCDDIRLWILPATANNFTTGSRIVSPLRCKCNFDCHIV